MFCPFVHHNNLYFYLKKKVSVLHTTTKTKEIYRVFFIVVRNLYVNFECKIRYSVRVLSFSTAFQSH